MAANHSSWRTRAFRQSVVANIEKAIQRSGVPTTKNSIEIEDHLFQRATSEAEYHSFVAKVILHAREINTKKTAAGMAPGTGNAGGPGES